MRTEFLRLANRFVVPLISTSILASLCFLFYLLSVIDAPYIDDLINLIPVVG